MDSVTTRHSNRGQAETYEAGGAANYDLFTQSDDCRSSSGNEFLAAGSPLLCCPAQTRLIHRTGFTAEKSVLL